MEDVTRIAIIGGGPGGYEAALVAAQLGADVTVIERDGPGGACVLTDCVPSKTLIATSTRMAVLSESACLGRAVLRRRGRHGRRPARSTCRSSTSGSRTSPGPSPSTSTSGSPPRGCEIVRGDARLVEPQIVAVGDRRIQADVVLIATGATPRVLPGAEPDGERILNWRQLYDLPELPEELIVVGSGVTGAEFAAAYRRSGRG